MNQVTIERERLNVENDNLLNIVKRDQMQTALVSFEGMLKIASAVVLACETFAVLADWSEILCVLYLLELEHSVFGES